MITSMKQKERSQHTLLTTLNITDTGMKLKVMGKTYKVAKWYSASLIPQLQFDKEDSKFPNSPI